MMLVDAEIGHIDWASYPCPCGRDGEHVAILLRALLASGTRFGRSALDGHVMVSSSSRSLRYRPWGCYLPRFYAEIFAGRSVDAAAYAFETLTLIEDDTPRIEAVRATAAGLLPRDLRDPAF